MNKTVLVIGGAGYIGSHMVLMLIEKDYRVIVFDNLSRGFESAIHSEATFFCGDLCKPEDLRNCMDTFTIDLVMHFAALAYVGESVQIPADYYTNNVIGTLNCLNIMRQKGINQFVFSSSCAVYGEPDKIPITENEKKNPVNPYGRTKWMIEQALQDYAHAYRINSISLRYFNAAGCDELGRVGEMHDPETHLIPLVLMEAMRVKQGGDPNNTELAVFGDQYDTPDGSCIRDYIHVSDICAAHLLAAKRLNKHGDIGAESFNLGNGSGYSVKEIVAACRKVTGAEIKYHVLSAREGDPAVLVGDAVKANKQLGWSPKYTQLDDIIETAWNWMKSQQHTVKPSVLL